MTVKERSVAPDMTIGDNQSMDRQLTTESVEGEIALVIDYVAGKSSALDVLGGAMALVQSIDGLDRALLSSLGGELEPVSILNDVQHSSLKLLLARALRKVPDEHIKNPDWKKWVGSLLVEGKHRLLQKLEADAPAIEAELKALEPLYQKAPELIGRTPPSVASIQTALQDVRLARAQFGEQSVLVQTELGDIALGFVAVHPPNLEPTTVVESVTNKLRERLKVRFPDMLGNAQWTVMRAGRAARVVVLHEHWLNEYHARRVQIQPGDSLDCTFEETVGYDTQGNELERKVAVIEIHGVIVPPAQTPLLLT